MKYLYAYCFQSGQIGLSESIPEGAIEISRSYSEKRLREFISVNARHAQGTETLLVPGVPEAVNELAAANALGDWLNWIEPKAGWAIEVSSMTRRFTAEEIETGVPAISDVTLADSGVNA